MFILTILEDATMKTTVKTGILFICFAIILSFFMQVKTQALEYKFNMSYIYFGNSSKYTALVDMTQQSLNEVAPNYFSLNSDGGLALTASVSAAFVSDMHRRGITVVPYLSNDWSRSKGKAALNNREELSKALADAVDLYNLDGVNIDIENVTPAERDAYVDFVRLLRELLPEGKTIAVSVAANPWGISTGWQGSYDYAGLAEYCDYLMIMAYDEHYYGGSAGPVSSYSFIEKSIKYAVSVVPKEKVVVGLPFYGRIWSNSGGYPNGYGVSNTKIAQLVKNYGGSVKVDAGSQSTRAVITVGPGDAKPIIGGQALAAGTYTIWYENEQSIKAKLHLINEYDIKGTGSWSLGQETENTWNYFKLWLNNCTFNDIQKSWAKEYILKAFKLGLIEGCSNSSFSADEPLTRAQAAVILVRCLGLTPEIDPSCSFDDCAGSWAEPYIDTARKNNIITGIGSNLFAPDKPVTREEIAVMINNALDLQNTNAVNSFSDVSQSAQTWSYNAIEALSTNSIITGYPDGTFRPGNMLTRAEMTVLIVKLSTS